MCIGLYLCVVHRSSRPEALNDHPGYVGVGVGPQTNLGGGGRGGGDAATAYTKKFVTGELLRARAAALRDDPANAVRAAMLREDVARGRERGCLAAAREQVLLRRGAHGRVRLLEAAARVLEGLHGRLQTSRLGVRPHLRSHVAKLCREARWTAGCEHRSR